MNTSTFSNSKPNNKSLWQRIFIVLLFLTIHDVISDDKYEHKIKVAYLYHFTKFAVWPIDGFSTKNSPIKICILGKSPFRRSLDTLSNKTSQNRMLVVKYLSFPENSTTISQCHIVFISISETHQLTKILKFTESTQVLTVSDILNFAQQGGIIGLVDDHRKIRIEINFSAYSRARVKLSSKLLQLATLIKTSQ